MQSASLTDSPRSLLPPSFSWQPDKVWGELFWSINCLCLRWPSGWGISSKGRRGTGSKKDLGCRCWFPIPGCRCLLRLWLWWMAVGDSRVPCFQGRRQCNFREWFYQARIPHGKTGEAAVYNSTPTWRRRDINCLRNSRCELFIPCIRKVIYLIV